MDELETELDSARDEITFLNGQVSNLKEKNSELQRDNDKLRDEVDTYEKYAFEAKNWISIADPMIQEMAVYLRKTAYEETKWDKTPAKGLGRPLRYKYIGSHDANRVLWMQASDGSPVAQSIGGDITSFHYEASGSEMHVTFAKVDRASSLGTENFVMYWQDAAAATMYNFADYYYHSDPLIQAFVRKHPPPTPPESGALRE